MTAPTKTKREQLEALVAKMRDKTAAVEAKGNSPSAGDLAELEEMGTQVDALVTEIKQEQKLDGMSDLQREAFVDALAGKASNPFAFMSGGDSSDTESKTFADAVINAGFDLKSQPTVEFSGVSALQKAPTFPATTVIAPSTPGITASGRDQRFLWPNLPRVDANGWTSVEDFRQTARTVTGDVERDIDADTDKAVLDVTLEHVVEAMKQWAVTIDDIPNAILQSMRNLRTFLDGEGRFQVEQAIDTHVMAQIVAATPPFGNTGTGLVEQIRNAVTAMRAEGASPSLLVLNAADAATLDLTEDAGGYVFPLSTTGASPLWGLRVIERPGTTPPYVIDPQMLGTLYLGAMRFDADPFTGFKKNLTTLRVETHGLYHVRNAKGARRVAAT